MVSQCALPIFGAVFIRIDFSQYNYRSKWPFNATFDITELEITRLVWSQSYLISNVDVKPSPKWECHTGEIFPMTAQKIVRLTYFGTASDKNASIWHLRFTQSYYRNMSHLYKVLRSRLEVFMCSSNIITFRGCHLKQNVHPDVTALLKGFQRGNIWSPFCQQVVQEIMLNWNSLVFPSKLPKYMSMVKNRLWSISLNSAPKRKFQYVTRSLVLVHRFSCQCQTSFQFFDGVRRDQVKVFTWKIPPLPSHYW